MADKIIAERVRELLNYDPETGIFTRKIRTAQRHKIGDRADFLVTSGNSEGYCRVSFDSKRYLAHRVVWLYVHGKWPELDIDHINGNKSDNRLANLREVDRSTNLQNMRHARKDNRSGFLGVTTIIQGKKWRATVHMNGKGIHVGVYHSPEEAHQAYLVAKRQIHEGCTI